MSSSPIFIHSLFRAGSTYLFNVFRRSPNGYFAYQEPLHEIAILARDEPERLLQDHGDEKVSLLRHPRIDAAYYKELHEVWPAWQDCLTEAAVYENYFAPDGADIGIDYWRVLAAVAKGRPVFQECRTAARIAAIRQQLDGFHVYLWRNPWDQWWSYKVAGYFDAANQMIVHAACPPAPVAALLDDLRLPAYGPGDVVGAMSFYLARPMTSEQSYLVFYLLWCLGLQHGQAHAGLLLNVDRLSDSDIYRRDVLAQLERSEIGGLDFSDCSMPQSRYSETERSWFSALEGRTHEWLKLGGWSEEELARIGSLREQFAPAVRSFPVVHAETADLLERLERARALACRSETAAAHALSDCEREGRLEQRARAAEDRAREAAARVDRAVERARKAAFQAGRAERAASSAETDAKQLRTRVIEIERQLQSLVALAAERGRQAEQAVAEVLEQRSRADEVAATVAQLRAQASALQAERDALRASWSWRVTAPLRCGWGTVLRGRDGWRPAAGRLALATVEALRWPIAAAMRIVLRDPQLSYRINQRLLKHPELHRRLVDIARRHGLMVNAPADAVAVALPVIPGSAFTGDLGGHPAGDRARRRRATLTGTASDIDELMLRVADEVDRWREEKST